MASLTRCDVCRTEYVPERRVDALRVERTSEVRRVCDAQQWDVCSATCLEALANRTSPDGPA